MTAIIKFYVVLYSFLFNYEIHISWTDSFLSIKQSPRSSTTSNTLQGVKQETTNVTPHNMYMYVYPHFSPGCLTLLYYTTVTYLMTGSIFGAENLKSFINQISPARSHKFPQIHILWQHTFFCGGLQITNYRFVRNIWRPKPSAEKCMLPWSECESLSISWLLAGKIWVMKL